MTLNEHFDKLDHELLATLSPSSPRDSKYLSSTPLPVPWQRVTRRVGRQAAGGPGGSGTSLQAAGGGAGTSLLR
eukprot:1716662-Rhodomonas_salina.1